MCRPVSAQGRLWWSMAPDVNAGGAAAAGGSSHSWVTPRHPRPPRWRKGSRLRSARARRYACGPPRRWNLAEPPAWFSVPGPRQAGHPGLRARPGRQCAAGVCQPLSAARWRLRAAPEHSASTVAGRVAPGEQLIRRDRDPPSILNRAESAWAMVIIQEYGGLALTRLPARAGGQMRAGPFRRAGVRGPACRDRRQRSQPEAQSAGQRRIASPRRAAG